MEKTEKEKKIAAALNTQAGRDKLGIAIVTGQFKIANNPGHPYQLLAQAFINHFAKRKVYCGDGETYLPNDLPRLWMS